MKEVVEGETRLLIREPVFYNPRMKLNRDICCAAVRVLKEDAELNFLDLLAGTGAKGLRAAKEGGCRVALNDANPRAWELIKRNAEINGLDVEVYNRKANQLLHEVEGFNFIDIDPFGSPVPFLDNAVMALQRGGYLGVTATDTAPLCGVHPRACLRKYGALSFRTDFCHELGMRILTAYIARTCAKYAKGVSCLLAHYQEHYFRVYLRVKNGKREADKALGETGYLYYCPRCLSRDHALGILPRERKCGCGALYMVAGPVWLGGLMEKGFVKRAREESLYLKDGRALGTLSMLLEEIEEPFYYDLHAICRSMKTGVPPSEKVLRELKNQGFEASHTHFSPTAVKTSADLESLKKILAGP